MSRVDDEPDGPDELTRAVRRAARLGTEDPATPPHDGPADTPDAPDDATRIARRPPLLSPADALDDATAVSPRRPDDATALSRHRASAPLSDATAVSVPRAAVPAPAVDDTDAAARARRELGLPAVAPLLADGPAGTSVPVTAPVYGIRRAPEEAPARPARAPGPAPAKARRRTRAPRTSPRAILFGVTAATVLVMAGALAGLIALLSV